MASTNDAQKMADKNAPDDREPNFWEKFLTWTQFIYMIRVPIVAGLVIFLFPLIVIYLAPTLLRGLYDLAEHPFRSSLWFSLFTFLFAWTVMISAKLVLFYGGERLGVDNHIQIWFREKVRKKYVIKYRLTFIIVLLGACLTLSGLFWINRLTNKSDYLCLLLGSICGLIAALILLFLADLIQSYIYPPRDAESLRYVLYPFNSKILERTRKRQPNSPGKVRKSRIINWIKSSRIIGRGYFCYDEPGAPLQGGHSTAMVLFVIFLTIYILFGFSFMISASLSTIFVRENYDIPWGVPAIVYIPILGAVLCWGLSAMTFFLDSYRIPLLVPVVFALVFMSFILGQGHNYQTLPRDTTRKAVLSPQEVAEEGKEDYIIVVAADGGGIQAAAWTAQVLSGLEQACRIEFNDSQACGSKIRLISSVSGGSIGAMYFVNAFNATDKGLPPDSRELQAIVERAETSSIKNVAWGLAYPDFLNSVLPVFDTDRGQELERAWADNSYLKTNEQSAEQIKAAKQSLKEPLSTWKEGVKEKWRPAIIFNTTIAETGERFLISTSDIDERNPDYNQQDAQTAEDCSRIAKENLSRPATGGRNFYEIFPCNDIPIMTAARLSASFPYVSPAARSKIKGEYNNYNKAHIVDGGYYDNYGIVSLSEWLDQLLKPENRPTTKVLVVQIRCNDTGYSSVENPTDGWLYQILAPLNTLYNVRTSGQRSRGDLEFNRLRAYWALKKDVNIQSVVFNFALAKKLAIEGKLDIQPENAQNKASQTEEYEPPLSWHLTPGEKQKIKEAWETNLTTPNEGWDSFKKILACFRTGENCESFQPGR